jgi:hypothetical protein
VRWGFKSNTHLAAIFNNIPMSTDDRASFTITNGVTYFHDERGMIDVWVSAQMVQPLLDLDGNLTSAERLAVKFRVANVIIRELMHVFYHAKKRYYGHNKFEYLSVRGAS